MKSISKLVALLSLAAVLLLEGGCGIDQGGADGATAAQPTTVVTASGAIATDSWGYTGASAALISAPAKARVVIEGHTLLEDALHVVVSGISPTAISYSSDPTTLPVPAQLGQPGTFVSYLKFTIGSTSTAQPALSATVDVSPLAAGQGVTIYRYDSATGKWVSPQSALVSSGAEVSFQASPLGIYGVFK